MSNATIRAPQRVANAIFYHLSSWRSLIGLVTIAVLTAISITFNYQLGLLMGSDSITRQLFPVGFAVLDLGALFLAAYIQMKSRSVVRKTIAWVWFFYLLCLSVWAAMSFTLASDARLSQSGYEMMKDAKIRALEQAEDQVELAQDNYAKTVRFKKLRMAELREAQSIRDDLIKEVQRLNNATPHVSMAIYYRTSALLHNHWGIDIDPKDLSSVVRMLWALALTLSPFILTTLVAFEIGSTNSSTPIDGNRRRYTNDSNSDTVPAGKTERVTETASNLAPAYKSSQSSRNSGDVEEKLTLDREALSNARQWVQGQSGRVQRQQIQYRSGQSKYKQTSLIIAELEREGWLHRLSNGQLKAGKPTLRAVQ